LLAGTSSDEGETVRRIKVLRRYTEQQYRRSASSCPQRYGNCKHRMRMNLIMWWIS